MGPGEPWWWWRARNRPTSRRDSLVVVDGKMDAVEPPTSHDDSLVVVQGRRRADGAQGTSKGNVK